MIYDITGFEVMTTIAMRYVASLITVGSGWSLAEYYLSGYSSI
jgi:hypothetical protein